MNRLAICGSGAVSGMVPDFFIGATKDQIFPSLGERLMKSGSCRCTQSAGGGL